MWLLIVLALAASAKEKIPLDFNMGIGGGQYRVIHANPENDFSVLSVNLDLSAVVYQETLEKYSDQIPPKYRGTISTMGEISASHLLIPRNIYFSGNHSERSAAGASWALAPTLGMDFGWFQWRLSLGFLATLLYLKEDRYDDSKIFFRPGFTLAHSFRIPISKRGFILEFGWSYDFYIPQELYADKTTWKMEGLFAIAHFRFPFEVEADIPKKKRPRGGNVALLP